MNLKSIIREIPDFPTKGINFKDITTLLKDKDAFQFVSNAIIKEFKGKGITKVLGIESRGFILGGVIARDLNSGFVPVRKEGKLPAQKISETYSLEYGTDVVEIHADALDADDVVLIHDDLLATGGTAEAVLKMVQFAGIQQIYFSFLCDLTFLDTPSKKVVNQYHPHVLVNY